MAIPARDTPIIELVLKSRTYSNVLLGLILSFVFIHTALHLHVHYLAEVPWLIQQLFELDEENNLPTWFASFLLLNAAVVLLLQGSRARSWRFTWRLLAAGFLAMAIDEVAGIHETINTVVDVHWVKPAAGMVFLLGLAGLPFLWSLERSLASRFLLAGTIYLSGALGVELFAAEMDEDTLQYGMATAVEEGFEMLGVWLFIRSNLQHLESVEFSLVVRGL